ncbi:hypothetical protein HOL82_02285 [Candidatus Woesearchaeota archaeon]|nr:hypothetical protein [Candidatus Woesearchaeota archaeon]
MKILYVLRLYLENFAIFTTPILFFSSLHGLLFKEFEFFNLFYVLFAPFALRFFIYQSALNPYRKILWTDLFYAKRLYLWGRSLLFVRWVTIPIIISIGFSIYQEQAGFGTFMWLELLYFYAVGAGTAYFGTSLLFNTRYREYKPFKNVINSNFLLKLFPFTYLFWIAPFLSFSFIQFTNVIKIPKAFFGGGLVEFKKIDQKLKIQLTKELLKMNERLSFFKTDEELIDTPEFTIISILDFIRWGFDQGMTLSPALHHIHNSFNWKYLLIKTYYKNSKQSQRNTDEEQKLKDWISKIDEMEKKVSTLIMQARGSIDDANVSIYEYIQTMADVEYPGVTPDNKVELNVDHIIARFKNLNLMV